MAHILKHPQAGNKGILLFTHKEIGYFSKFRKRTRFEVLNQLQEQFLPVDEYQPFFDKHLQAIREKYFLGVHFGWWQRDYPTMPYLDFYMGGEGALTFKEPEKIFFIPLSSRTFIPAAHKADPTAPKIWDILCISNNANHKRLHDLLGAIRKIYDAGYSYRILLLVPTKLREDGHASFYQDLENDYYSQFSYEERNDFILMRLSPKLAFLGMPFGILTSFYQQSRVFTLFSDEEGEPRVISEALICELPIVAYRHTKAATTDFLDEKNSVLFDTYEASHTALIQAVEQYEHFDIDGEAMAKVCREDYTLLAFREYMQTIYQQAGQTFDGELINEKNLFLGLNAHDLDVPWARGRFSSADILTKPQFETLLTHLQLA